MPCIKKLGFTINLYVCYLSFITAVYLFIFFVNYISILSFSYDLSVALNCLLYAYLPLRNYSFTQKNSCSNWLVLNFNSAVWYSPVNSETGCLHVCSHLRRPVKQPAAWKMQQMSARAKYVLFWSLRHFEPSFLCR